MSTAKNPYVTREMLDREKHLAEMSSGERAEYDAQMKVARRIMVECSEVLAKLAKS